jgi:hypothetical protein
MKTQVPFRYLRFFVSAIQGGPMSHEEIVSRLTQLTEDPAAAVFSITSRTILAAIVQRMGLEALSLTPEDLQLAIDGVRAALEHNLDEREYISEAYGRAARKTGEVVEWGTNRR